MNEYPKNYSNTVHFINIKQTIRQIQRKKITIKIG